MSDYRHLRTRREGASLVCEIDNPPRNFLNVTTVGELSRLMDEVETDGNVRALVITGAVDGIFVTHYDVGELAVTSDAAREHASIGTGDELHGMHRLLVKLQASRLPIIAAINGTAMGGGCELALACDFRYMSRRGQIGLPEVRVGILPGAGGTQRMARLLGTAKALELMLLGNTLDADTAERAGLVNPGGQPGMPDGRRADAGGRTDEPAAVKHRADQAVRAPGDGDAVSGWPTVRAGGVLADDAI